MTYNLLENLRKEKTTYSEMVHFCTDNSILNNNIIRELSKVDIFPELFCGNDYDEENDTYVDIYQYYIIDYQGAERFKEYTNEIVYCYPDLDLYILAVQHWGTPWNGVNANWKETEEDE